MSSFIPASRRGIRLLRSPVNVVQPGAIFKLNDSSQGFKGFVLVHNIGPPFNELKDGSGNPLVADHIAVVEFLRPEQGYRDYCVYRVLKADLEMPDQQQFDVIHNRLYQQLPNKDA